MSSIQGLDKLARKLKTLERFQEKLTPPMTKATALIHNKMGKYVKKSPGAFSRLASPAQKRAYWARVSSGQINHREGIGYVRSGTLGRKWTSKVSRHSGGVTGEVGNNASYGVLVQGRKQQPFHAASGWPRADKVLKENSDAVGRFFHVVVKRELGK